MKHLFAAAGLALGLAAGPARADDSAWYVGKYGPTQCVPLTSLNNNLQLDPAGGDGSIQEPTDMIGRFVMAGAHPRLVYDDEPMEVWSDRLPGDKKDTYYLFFHGLNACKVGMQYIEEHNK
jgi:hypothetical protein